MNSKQLRTLKRVFDSPTRSDVTWAEVESLLRAQGATFREGPLRFGLPSGKPS